MIAKPSQGGMASLDFGRKTSLCIMLVVTIACAPKSADERDWRETQAKVTDFEGVHAEYARGHLKRYPNCPHRRSAEAFFVTRCNRHPESCGEYFDLFPGGERRNELEAVIWQSCEAYTKGTYVRQSCSNCCDFYRKNFPNGPNIGVLNRLEARMAQEREATNAAWEQRKKEDAAREAQAWSHELVDLMVDYPPDGASQVTLSVMGRAVHPHDNGTPATISVPTGYPVDVCYHGNTSIYGSPDCVSVQPQGYSLRVPLTRVYVSYPKSLMALCYMGLPPKELWVMPGRRSLSCRFDRSLPHGYQETKDDVTVEFDAPDTGGTVHVVFSKDGNLVKGEALIFSEWQGRLFPE